MQDERDTGVAVIVGASGGIGSALVAALLRGAGFATVVAASRRPVPLERAISVELDLDDEDSIAAAAARAASLGTVRLVIVASGILQVDGAGPEKALRDLAPERLARAYRVNAIGPALVAKHFLPLFPRQGRSVFAALSAKVGSIEDNRLGGWHAYRASKSGLNMLMRTIAIEERRTRPDAICVVLHPGTVATRLSAPFQAGIAEDRLSSPDRAADRLLRVLDGLTPAQTGGFFSWNGSALPF